MRRKGKIKTVRYDWRCTVCDIPHEEQTKCIYIKFERRTKKRGPKNGLVCTNCAAAIKRILERSD